MTAVRPDDTAGTGERAMALVRRAWEAHAYAMEALGADVHPYSADAIRTNEAELTDALGCLVAAVREAEARAERAETVVDAARRMRYAVTLRPETVREFDDAMAAFGSGEGDTT